MTEPFIPYSTQDIDADDIAAVTEVLRSPFITQGPAIERFERTIGNYCNVPQAVAVSSATAGIHIALAAMDVGSDSRVWTSPITFVASANAACMLGAEVSFVDIDPSTGNIDIVALEEMLAAARVSGTLPRALVVVHYTGRPCDMAAIHALCSRHDIAIIEDAAHALGAQYEDGLNVGHSHYSDASVFSFHPVKSITTGEGGLVTTRSADVAKRLRRLRSHGISRERGDFSARPQREDQRDTWYYEQLELGYNYRMTDIQAVLGTSQMKRLDSFIAARRGLANRYGELLRNVALHLPLACERSAWHLYVVRVDDGARLSRRELFDVLSSANIGVNVHYIPVHLHPYYARRGFKPGDYPNSELFYTNALSLPLYPKLTPKQQDRIVDVIQRALE